MSQRAIEHSGLLASDQLASRWSDADIASPKSNCPSPQPSSRVAATKLSETVPWAVVGADGTRTLVRRIPVSVILSTYNSPQWLEKVVWGYTTQTYSNFELIIADDGSTEETAKLIRRLRQQTRLDIRHVWHEDQGFRKCRILNRAIEAAAGQYLVFSDGDCIPRHDFLETHVQFAEANCCLSGGCFRLPFWFSQKLAIDDILDGQAFSTPWLLQQGLPVTAKLLKLIVGSKSGWWMNRLTMTRSTWNGHNASGWKSDLIAVNGFDERMRYGGEDREMGERLVNAGAHFRQVRYSAICLHLDHPRSYVNDEDWQRNNEIRRETRRTRSVCTSFGIHKLPREQSNFRYVA